VPKASILSRYGDSEVLEWSDVERGCGPSSATSAFVRRRTTDRATPPPSCVRQPPGRCWRGAPVIRVPHGSYHKSDVREFGPMMTAVLCRQGDAIAANPVDVTG
jgi:hypothetical protein